MKYSAEKNWNKLYRSTDEMAYPAEGVIRIFKGSFPDLDISKDFQGKQILDLGCGDGRHLAFFNSLGLECFGVEISDEIVNKLDSILVAANTSANIRTGHAGNIPFSDSYFDYLLTWNSCYYMSVSDQKFEDYVDEMARVLKPNGLLVCSVPKKTSFIFSQCEDHLPGYKVIKNDYFQARDGEVMRCFDSEEDLINSFSPQFTDFIVSEIHMNWFGLNYHWYILIAKRAADPK